MVPKFRGNSDDWLDDQKSRKKTSSSSKKKSHARALALSWEEANGTVAEVYPKLCSVFLDDGRMLLCSYRRSTVLGHSGQEYRERSPVAVGDRVKAVAVGQKDGIVEGVCERKNRLVRPAPARDEKQVHVIAANIDTLVVVTAAREPDFSPGLVDRFLVAAGIQGIRCILCINKIDLLPDGLADQSSENPWKIYSEVGVELFKVSVKNDSGVAELCSRLIGQTVVFCGHSGVGKTSLLTALLGREVGKVGDVSDVTGKGRHTTTSAVLVGTHQGSRWIDTPGVREFGLLDVDPKMLGAFFPEFSDLECSRSYDCRHSGEDNCVAVSLPRYSSYRRIYDSLLAGEN